jgi:hypothetical protein
MGVWKYGSMGVLCSFPAEHDSTHIRKLMEVYEHINLWKILIGLFILLLGS